MLPPNHQQGALMQQDLRPKLLLSGAVATGRGLHNDSHRESGFDPREAVSGALGVPADPTPSLLSHLAFHPGTTTPASSLSPGLWPGHHGFVIVCFVTVLALLLMSPLYVCFSFHIFPILPSALHSFIPCTLVLLHHVTHIWLCGL